MGNLTGPRYMLAPGHTAGRRRAAFHSVKMAPLPKAIYRVSATPIKIPTMISGGTEKATMKFI